MKLISLVLQGNIKAFFILISLGIISGGIHVLLLININDTLTTLLKGGEIKSLFFIYTIALLIGYLILNRWFSGFLIKFSQKTIHDLRMRLMRSVLLAGYGEMKEEQESLYAAISKDTIVISHATLGLIQLITSLVTIIGCLIYLAYLSVYVFLFILVISGAGIGIYTLFSRRSFGELKKARENEDKMFYHVRQVIDGFREIKINPAKGKELVEGALYESSLGNYNSATKGFIGYFNSGVINQFVFYVALVSLVYAGSFWFGITGTVLMSCVMITLYLVGPLELSTALMPQLAEGDVAAIRFTNMLKRFSDTKEAVIVPDFSDFYSLKFEAVNYHYPAKKQSEVVSFQMGPIDFELKKGEITFIHGGNGAGKTTFIYLFLGLLQKGNGRVFLNNELVNSTPHLSNLFAPVFSDYHLFDSLYGIEINKEERVQKYLELFELDKKVTFINKAFSSTKLSTGQRKRLALISILLEDRPILVLDEWAADQDPAFRNKFYTEIITTLKEEGYTILAITHDDKYYNMADSLYRMEYGTLIQEK